MTSVTAHIAFKRKSSPQSHGFICTSVSSGCFQNNLQQNCKFFTRYKLGISCSVQFASVSWLRAVSRDNRLQIKQQTGIVPRTSCVPVTSTQEAHGKTEGLICPGVQGLQVAEAVTVAAAMHSSHFAVHSFSIFLDVYWQQKYCNVEINSCRINHKHICGEWFLSEWPWLYCT